MQPIIGEEAGRYALVDQDVPSVVEPTAETAYMFVRRPNLSVKSRI